MVSVVRLGSMEYLGSIGPAFGETERYHRSSPEEQTVEVSRGLFGKSLVRQNKVGIYLRVRSLLGKIWQLMDQDA